MSTGADTIPSLHMRLSIHRRTVAYLEEQRAHFGALAPIHIRHQLDEARQQIALVKADLRALGVAADEQPGDLESDWPSGAAMLHSLNGSALRAYLRTLVDRLSYLSLDGLAEWRGPALPLAQVYIERTLTPLTAGMPAASLAALLADRHARLLVEAEPGGGKTVALRRLALACATLALGNEREPPFFPRLLDPPLVPLLLEAHELIRSQQHNQSSTGQIGLWEMIEANLRCDGLASALPALEHALRVGDCLVLIDGLDDVVDNERGRVLITMLVRFVARYPDSRYVLTCRHLAALPVSSLFGFSSYSLPPFDDTGIDKLIAAYYPLITPLMALGFDEPDAQIAKLRSQVQANDRLHTLATNPLGAVLCLLTNAEGHTLPVARGLVFGRMVDLLLDGWERFRREGGAATLAQVLEVPALAGREARLALLQPLALAFQMRPDLSGDTPATLRSAEVEPWLRESLIRLGVESRRAVEQVIPRLLAWCCRQGLLVSDSTGSEYAMPWRGLREYLAARALVSQQDFPGKAYALAGESRWRDTLLLAVRDLSQGAGSHTARELLRLLLETPSGDTQRIVSDPLLAAECLLEFSTLSGPERYMLGDAQDRLQEMLQMVAAPASERVRAGLLLGQLGDPRFAQLLPPLVRVPAGLTLFGGRDGYEDEGPQQWVDVPAFAIGVYPVTNREYARFLAESPAQAVPKYWYNQAYNNPSQPVVGLLWHDAVAYCRWLTSKLHSAGFLPTSMEARLPLEVEWEKAASWDARRQVKRIYPWGDSWLPGAANTTEGRGTWVTAPVGAFPAGISAYGAHDMIGNVWEWTASEYASYPGALAPFHEGGSYTLRGSSCASLPTHARCTYRSRLPADYWRYHLGFRIVLGRPLAALGAV